MKYIGVVECISSGRMYVDDIIALGYTPLIINTHTESATVHNYRKILLKEFEGKAEFIDMGPDFDEFICRLKKYDLVAVFPGSEYGVQGADLINDALGLRGNGSATTYLRHSKAGMFEALDRAGLRRIETQPVNSDADIREFWNKHGLKRCVLKYSESQATVGLKICDTIEDAIDHYHKMLESPTDFGEIGADVLIQEYIGGTEYIVDTISCDGKHLLTDIWVYAKVTAEDGTLAYDYSKLVKDLEPGHSEMIRYVYKVLDAVEMKWGPCHTEVKIDHKGPVLIETNARLLGLGMTANYLDEILGHHITNISLDLYFNPKRYKTLSRKIYNPRKYALMKLMIVPEKITGDLSPAFIIGNIIRSTREILFFGSDRMMTYNRTVDLDTSPLTIKMVNEDYGALMRDYEILRLAESNYFHLFYTLGGNLPAVEKRTDVNKIIAEIDPARKFLLVSDEGDFVVQFGEKKPVQVWEIYDGAIYAVSGEMTKEQRYRSILKVMYNIRPGGIFIAVPESYEAFENGPVLMDFLMNITNIRVIAPSADSVGVVVGMKE